MVQMEGCNGSRNLSQRTADRLLSQIMDAKAFIPGQKLPNENELSESFGVSRATLREAVRILVARGVLEVRRGTGTFVSGKLPERSELKLPDAARMTMEMRDLYEARLIVEPQAAALACERATDDELGVIAGLARAVQELTEAGEDTTDADLAFHSAVMRAAHNEFILYLIPIIELALSDKRVLEAEAKHLKSVLPDHEMIVDSLIKRDAQSAESAVRIHLRRLLGELNK